MRRAFFAIAGVIAAILCLATAVLWVRSGWIYEYLQWVGPQREFCVESNRGLTTAHLRSNQNSSGWHYKSVSLQSIEPFLFDKREDWFELSPNWMLSVPDWVLCLSLASLSAASFRLRKRRFPIGQCADCGYDLRASRYRCPECGKIIND